MYCPNCGGENRGDQHYCRSCGLKLDAVVRVVSEQFPSEEYAALQRRKELFERLGVGALSIAGVIALALFITKVGYYKLLLFGPEVLFGSAAAALVAFMLLSVFFFNYPKFFMKFDNVRSVPPAPENPVLSKPTSRLIDGRPFAPAASVTEGSTEPLVEVKKAE